MTLSRLFFSSCSFLTWGDGILGHQINRRLEFFVPCYSQSLLLADFTEKTVLFSGFIKPYRKIFETRNLKSIHE
jgi:hypothetical protein